MRRLTFDREADFLGDPLPLGVEHVAGVAPAVRPGHPLHHEALVADDDAAPHVVVQSLALEHKRKLSRLCTLGQSQYVGLLYFRLSVILWFQAFENQPFDKSHACGQKSITSSNKKQVVDWKY